MSLGLGAAWRSRGSVALIAGAVLAVGATTSAVVFSAGLGRLLDEPDRYGWPFDAAALVNAGYGPAHLDAVRDSLQRSEVLAWETASIISGVTVDDVALPMLSPRQGMHGIFARTPVTDGRLPRSGEIALGAVTADRLHVSVGDTVEVAMSYGRARARVSGIVVLPAIGPLESDRLTPGVGVLVDTDLFESILDQAQSETGMRGPELADEQAGFVAIDLAPGVDAPAFLRSIDRAQREWTEDPDQVQDLPRPVRPPAIVDAAGLRVLPAALAATITVGGTLAVVVGIASLTRSRRHELAILRALGAAPRTLRGTVVVHSTAVVASGLVVGLPLGMLAGTAGYAAFARSIGVATTGVIPSVELAAIAVASIAVGVATGCWPRRPASDGVEGAVIHVAGPWRGLAE